MGHLFGFIGTKTVLSWPKKIKKIKPNLIKIMSVQIKAKM